MQFSIFIPIINTQGYQNPNNNQRNLSNSERI